MIKPNSQPIVYVAGFPDSYTPFSGKPGLLMVGSNTWQREKLTSLGCVKLLEQYDMFLFFFPTADNVYRVGTMIFSRGKHCMPVSFHVEHACATTAMDMLMDAISKIEFETPEIKQTLYLWYNNWIYRSPKLSLKEVLNLETYK